VIGRLLQGVFGPAPSWASFGLPGRDRHAGPQGLLRELAVRQPAGGGHVCRGVGSWRLVPSVAPAVGAMGLARGRWRLTLSDVPVAMIPASADIARRDRCVPPHPTATVPTIAEVLAIPRRQLRERCSPGASAAGGDVWTTCRLYMITAYTPNLWERGAAPNEPGRPDRDRWCGRVELRLAAVMARCSDKSAAGPLLLACTILVLVSAYPAMVWLTRAPFLRQLLGVELWLLVPHRPAYNGAMVVHLTEIMPAHVPHERVLARLPAFATALFGGFTPAVSTWLIPRLRKTPMPGAWLCFAAACGLGATLAGGGML